jgi:outer membrane autotransporter protein
LAIGHSYSLAGDGTFQARVNRDGTNGRLQINGEAGLDGNLTVVRGKGYFTNGTRYTILTANGVNGWFSSESLPKPTPLLSFQATGHTDRVEVEARAKSFTTAAKNSWQMKIAQSLDKIAPTAKEDTSNILGEFQTLSEPELQKAFPSFSPDSYGKFSKAALQSARKYSKNLHDRMHAVRLYGTPAFEPAVQAKSFSDLSRQAMALADSALSLDDLYAQGKLTQAQGRNGLWLDSFGQKGQGGSANGTGGFGSSLNGTSFGFDYAPSKGIVSGVSAGCSGDRIGLGENLGQGNIQAAFTSAYGSYATKYSYLEAVLSYTRNQYENSRHLSVGSITEQVSGNHGGETFSSYLRIGRYFQMGGGALLEPFAAMEYTHLYEEGFRESGAGGINLRIADRRVNSLAGEVGLRLSWPVEIRYGRLVPEISASWDYDFKIDDRRIDASFADSPGSEFSIPEQDPGRHSARLRAGLSLVTQKGLSASVHYDGEFSRHDGGHAIFGFLRYEY